MSKSRLEKFLYALYSLDSSDLPKPLSRIEELYKCLVTGEEAPTFEPTSRVEKYLMAILGGYDVDSLPNPLSRVEVLLYKLATGDDNLDDVKSFLSEHEELLAEIIRNGGVGGNIDIEYVLHTLSTGYNTLYNTAEKPVKSAILKGNTLINLFDGEKMALNESVHYTYSNGIIQCYVDGSAWTSKTNLSNAIKPNTKYLLKEKNVGECPLVVEVRTDLSKLLHIRAIEVGRELNEIITTEEKIDGLYVKVYPQSDSDGLPAQAKINIIEYQDGMENWDIPYFEGMQSVRMPVLTTTGKNLVSKTIRGTQTSQGGIQSEIYRGLASEDLIKVKKGETYKLSGEPIPSSTYAYATFDINKIFLGMSWGRTYNVSDDVSFVRPFMLYSKDTDLSNATMQLEENSVVTSYEPFKSNILTTPEDVTLRGIGTSFKDELNLLTGELTKRVGEIVFDGSEDWSTASFNASNTECVIFVTTISDKTSNWRYSCDMFKTCVADVISVENVEGVCNGGGPTGLFINVSKTKASTVEDFKNWLSNNNVTVQYQSIESVKTVDLSVVDQNGNDTKLSTFNDITHVTLSSEGLIPEAEFKVATKNEEVLNTMSLEMDDISTTQNALQETSNAQSENVDSTMIATTEIYEGLL